MKTIGLIHKDCFDGTGAGWVLRRAFPEAEIIETDYRDPVPVFTESHVLYILDFSYELEDLKALALRAEKLIMMDHHPRTKAIAEAFNVWCEETGKLNCAAHFADHQSGALMTWEYFNKPHPAPEFIEAISDRDLWQFKLASTKCIMAGLGSYPLSVDAWNRAIEGLGSSASRFSHHLKTIGPTALRIQENHVRWAIKHTQRTFDISWVEDSGSFRGAKVPLINTHHGFMSDALAELATGHMFAVAYFDTENCRKFSLRSTVDGYDVRHVARHYGGDGHTHAAGFSVPRTHPLAQF